MRTLVLQERGAPLGAFLDANAHAFTRAEVLECGSRRSLENLVDSGAATRILPGVYAATMHAETPRVLGEALNLWHPAGLVTGALALRIYAEAVPLAPRAALRVTTGACPRPPSWLTCLQGEPIRSWQGPQGVDCALPAKALLDAWRLSASADRKELFWETLWARVCTARQVAHELERTPRLADRRVLERLVGWFADGATTPLEVRAQHETFTGRRFEAFERQAWLSLPARRVRVDMLHRASATVVELEGDRYHSTREQRDADRQRRTELAAAGYVTLAFGWRDIADRPAWCREQVLATVARRGGAVSPGRT